jgi:hypothetical protein
MKRSQSNLLAHTPSRFLNSTLAGTTLHDDSHAGKEEAKITHPFDLSRVAVVVDSSIKKKVDLKTKDSKTQEALLIEDILYCLIV